MLKCTVLKIITRLVNLFVCRTSLLVLFKKGGGHVSSKLANSSASAKFHNDLAELISKCNSKEEILITIKKYAKETLTSESYKEFVDIFNKVFKTIG